MFKYVQVKGEGIYNLFSDGSAKIITRMHGYVEKESNTNMANVKER